MTSIELLWTAKNVKMVRIVRICKIVQIVKSLSKLSKIIVKDDSRLCVLGTLNKSLKGRRSLGWVLC